MKTAKINYKQVGEDQIQILGFEGISNMDDVVAKKGKDVAKAYVEGYPCFRGNNSTVEVISDKKLTIYNAGLVLPKVDFEEMVSTMKHAGQRLAKIEKEISVRTIEI